MTDNHTPSRLATRAELQRLQRRLATILDKIDEALALTSSGGELTGALTPTEIAEIDRARLRIEPIESHLYQELR